jgi:Na+/melibiose symporter-like transporter
MALMNTMVGRMLIGLGAAFVCVVSGLVVLLYFHHDQYWTPYRLGGLYVALPCVPICIASFWVWVRVRLRVMDENHNNSN